MNTIIRRCFFDLGKTELFTHKTVLHFNKSPIIAYNTVADMNSYPTFVPWVTECRVSQKSANYAEANMTIGFPPITQTYLSKVTLAMPSKIVSVSNKNSVFEVLESIWEFYPEKSELAGSADDHVKLTKCETHYSVKFRFSNIMYQNLSTLVFQKVCHETASAFTKKINAVNGNIECLYDKKNQKFLTEAHIGI
ncbi:unnamed protein product [Blepharisma stoltei]|uniref:Coenzyme Q-binding protein COQ10 START domain-containing protein n=1 Tax=Blepharisma stoltei TaxID=1481888 RepID=A0AAU9IHJ3_9CILI|nr:unnamed protein product [Blepharisma stoltei]